jgi:hypothetical protein
MNDNLFKNNYPNTDPNQNVQYSSNMINLSNPQFVDTGNTQGKKLTGVPGCTKCGGTGYKAKKEKEGKIKPCKVCVRATGMCLLCNNTGMRVDKAGKKCKCREDKDTKDKKKDKKDNKEKNEKSAEKEKKK